MTPSSATRLPKHPAQRTALVVNTDRDSRESLCKLLGESQIHALGAPNGVAALRVLQNEAVDIMICEDLGGFHGIEMLEACEALFPHVRRVFLEKNASPELHGEAIFRGHAHATVSNAMHPVDLRDIIAALVAP
jgi:response regulator RpfG family c-di-GMP phosphodiesterase